MGTEETRAGLVAGMDLWKNQPEGEKLDRGRLWRAAGDGRVTRDCGGVQWTKDMGGWYSPNAAGGFAICEEMGYFSCFVTGDVVKEDDGTVIPRSRYDAADAIDARFITRCRAVEEHEKIDDVVAEFKAAAIKAAVVGLEGGDWEAVFDCEFPTVQGVDTGTALTPTPNPTTTTQGAARTQAQARRGSIDFDRIKNRLLNHAESLLREWLPGGRRQGNEYIALNPMRDDNSMGSFSINVTTGRWSDFSMGEKGGDLISLYSYLNGMSNGEAAKALAEGDHEYTAQNNRGRPTTATATAKAKDVRDDKGRILCLPKPEDAPEPPNVIWVGDKYRKPDAIYTYTDKQGEILRLICRFEKGEGMAKKEFRPLTVWRDKSGKLSWQQKDIPDDRPLYGLESLAHRPDAPVLVVSGEKCVDIAKGKLPGYVVTTWSGGDKATNKTDFSPLKNRTITWWPDNDVSSRNAMQELADKFGGKTVYIDPDNGKYAKGWDCADAVAEGADLEGIISITDVPVGKYPSPEERAPKDIFVHTSDKGAVQGTEPNFYAQMQYYGIELRYNVISNDIESSIGGVRNKTHNSKQFEATVRSVCNLNGFPRHDITTYTDGMADRNRINPVMDWVTLKPWDGKDRIQELCDAVQCDESITAEFKDILISKWLISAYAAASREDGDDFRARGVLVFQGAQGIGKTTFLRSLCGAGWGGDVTWFGEGLTLDPDNKDSIMNAQSFWIVELAELENTTRKALAPLKAYLTNTKNKLRAPYAKAPSTIWNRTVYAGTVNQKDVLTDTTGNSRFWCLPVLSFGDISQIDMQQVWAEVKVAKEEGKIWWLTGDEEKQLEENNREYVIGSPVDDLLAEKLDWERPRDDWSKKTCAVVLKDCGMQNPNTSDNMRAGAFIRKKLGMSCAPQRGTRGAVFYLWPPLKVQDERPDNQNPLDYPRQTRAAYWPD